MFASPGYMFCLRTLCRKKWSAIQKSQKSKRKMKREKKGDSPEEAKVKKKLKLKKKMNKNSTQGSLAKFKSNRWDKGNQHVVSMWTTTF